jgi:hypothetical protein
LLFDVKSLCLWSFEEAKLRLRFFTYIGVVLSATRSPSSDCFALMESNDDSQASSPADEEPPPSLPAGERSLRRLTDHATGLTDDVRAWLELRYKLAKIELYERLDEQADELVLYALVGAIGAVGGSVMLLATCFAASWFISWLTNWTFGALTLGFLLVAVVVFTLAGLLFAAKPRFGLFESRTRAVLSEEQVMEGPAAGEPTSGPEA